MKEDFQRFWEYSTAGWAGKFLDQWYTRAMKSKIEPMKMIAKSFRSKRELILNWFRAGGTLSFGSVEGFNNKVKLVNRKSYGIKTQDAYEIALYHNLGDLPQLEFTHRFFERGKKTGWKPILRHRPFGNQSFAIPCTFIRE